MSDAKKNVLLSFVGKTDPWSTNWEIRKKKTPYDGVDEDDLDIATELLYRGTYTIDESSEKEGAILGLCTEIDGENSPDILYMFPSCAKIKPLRKDNTEWRAEWVKNILSVRYPNIICRIMPLDIDDPTDFEQISREWDRNIGLILEELKGEGALEDYQFHINCTSATQQMTAVAYVFASTGRIPGIIRWQCMDPMYSKPGDRTREINATFLEESAYRDRIREGIRHLDFSTVRENFSALSRIAGMREQQQRKELFDFMKKVFSAYNALDMLRYETAYSTLHEAELHAGYKLLEKEQKKIFDRQIRLLKKLKDGGEGETVENLSDLYHNMQRCFNRGAYADVLSRFWRIGEGSVYYVLENRWGINPRDMKNSKKKDNLQMLLDNDARFKLKYPKQYIGFDNGRYALLYVFKDQAAVEKEFAKFFKNDVKEMTEQRNGTIVAHGMGEVSEDDAKKCLQYAERILYTLIPSAKKGIEKHPFKKEDLQIWEALF